MYNSATSTTLFPNNYAGFPVFGFNGKEKDDEIKGNGNSLDFGARIYDPRVGRWLACDPLAMKYSDLSPYQFCANNPIMNVDPDGEQIVDSKGHRVRVKINKDSKGNYVASYHFSWFTKKTTKDEFKANAGEVITSMLKTETGPELVRQANQDLRKVHISLVTGEKTYTDAGVTVGPFGATAEPQDPQNPIAKKVSDVYNIDILEGNFEKTQEQVVEGGAKTGDLITIAGKKVELSSKRVEMANTVTSLGEFRAAVGAHEFTEFLTFSRPDKIEPKTEIKVQEEYKKATNVPMFP